MTKQVPGAAPDAIFVFAALLPWQFFSMALTEAAGSLVGNANLIAKVYFPRAFDSRRSGHHQFRRFRSDVGFLCLLLLWYQFLPGIAVSSCWSR